MHRSSENVAAIATALAKVQIELTNPEKATIGTIYNARSDSSQNRYASPSSGLDIIRKALGGQQIAIAQTTDIDRATAWSTSPPFSYRPPGNGYPRTGLSASYPRQLHPAGWALRYPPQFRRATASPRP